MIILPLGIGKKVPSIPVLTIAITVISVILSVQYFSVLAGIEKSPILKTVEDSRSKAIGEFCPRYGLTSEQCLTVTQMVTRTPSATKSEKPQNTQEFAGLGGVFEYLTWVGGQLSNPTDEEFLRFQPYQDYLTARENMKVWISEDYSEILSIYSINFKSLLLAQFIHIGWLHLIGNFIVFLAFGIFLEQRLNPIVFLSVYFVGGTIGLFSQMFLFADPNMAFLVGASADISAVMGAVFVLFFRARMKFLVSLIFWNKVFTWPINFMVPLLYVAADLAGVLGGTTSVAHGAHLVGFAAGAVIGLFAVALDPLDETYLYPQEKKFHLALRKMQETSQKITIANKILGYNPDNVVVVAEVCASIFKDFEQSTLPSESSGIFLNNQLIPFIINCWNSLRWHQLLLDFCEKIPEQFNLLSPLKGLGQEIILGMASFAIAKKKYFLALRLYDQYLVNYPLSRQRGAIIENVSKILEVLTQLPESPVKIRKYYDSNLALSQILGPIDQYYGEKNNARIAS